MKPRGNEITKFWFAGVALMDLGSTDWDFDNNVANDINQNINGHIDAAFSVVQRTVKFD